ELRKEWDSRLTDPERQALAAVHRREIPFARPARGEGAAVDYALKHSFVRDAVVGERKLLTEALKRGIGSVTVEAATRELAGLPVVALAQSTAAVDVLRQEAHFGKADTVARFLRDRNMQDSARDGVVLVDEAGLLGTRDMLGLLDAAEDIGARIVLVGDRKQN